LLFFLRLFAPETTGNGGWVHQPPLPGPLLHPVVERGKNAWPCALMRECLPRF
jgi:hypothetical protein